MATFDFLNIGSSAYGGEPFCEDFNENMLCSAATFPTNNSACNTATPAYGGSTGKHGFPTSSTVCGDGNLDRYENCDWGTTLGSNPACIDPATSLETINGGTFCSTTCRWVVK